MEVVPKTTTTVIEITTIISQTIPTTSSSPSNHYADTVAKLLSDYNPGPMTLPPRRDDDYKLQLIASAYILSPRPLIPLAHAHQELLANELSSLLEQGFVVPTNPVSYAAVPFVTKGKKDRIVFDYRGLNSIVQSLPSLVYSLILLVTSSVL